MPHRFPLTVYYEDTDMAGVVYYANYLRYTARARSEIVEQCGLDQNAMKAAGLVFVVTRVEADYLAPARLGDRLEGVTTHKAASAVRWTFDQEVQRDGVVIFRAHVVAVAMTTAVRTIVTAKGSATAHRAWREHEFHGAGALKLQRRDDRATLFNAFGQAHEHDVVAARLQLLGGPWGNHKPAVDGAHPHGAIDHRHFVDLDERRKGR